MKIKYIAKLTGAILVILGYVVGTAIIENKLNEHLAGSLAEWVNS